MSTRNKTIINLNDDLGYDESQMIDIENTNSKTSQIPFFQILKYCHFIQEDINFKQLMNNIKNKFKTVLECENLSEESFTIFLNLLSEKSSIISKDNYWELFKLSEIFEVKILENKLNKYAVEHSKDLSFIIRLMIERQEEENNEQIKEIEGIITNKSTIKIEEILSKQINECLCNKYFNKLSNSSIYRILEKSKEMDERICSDLLFEFINKSIEERYLFFTFLKISELSERNFEILYQNYLENQKNQKTNFYIYLPIEIEYIRRLKEDNEQIRNKLNEIQNKLNKTETEKNKEIKEIQNKLNKTETEKNKQIKEIQNKLRKTETEKNKEIEEIQNKLNKTETEKKEQLCQLKEEKKIMEKKINNFEQENKILKKRIENQTYKEKIIKIFYSHKDKIEECWSIKIEIHELTSQFYTMHVKSIILNLLNL